MPVKKEMIKLAGECTSCTVLEEGDMDMRIKKCPACEEFKNKSMLADVLRDTAHVIAQKPEDERFEIIKERLETFIEMDDKVRREAIIDLVDAISDLAVDEAAKLMKTIEDVLDSMSDEYQVMFKGELVK